MSEVHDISGVGSSERARELDQQAVGRLSRPASVPVTHGRGAPTPSSEYDTEEGERLTRAVQDRMSTLRRFNSLTNLTGQGRLDIPLPEGIYDRPDGRGVHVPGGDPVSAIDKIRDLLAEHASRDDVTLKDLEKTRKESKSPPIGAVGITGPPAAGAVNEPMLEGATAAVEYRDPAEVQARLQDIIDRDDLRSLDRKSPFEIRTYAPEEQRVPDHRRIFPNLYLPDGKNTQVSTLMTDPNCVIEGNLLALTLPNLARKYGTSNFKLCLRTGVLYRVDDQGRFFEIHDEQATYTPYTPEEMRKQRQFRWSPMEETPEASHFPTGGITQLHGPGMVPTAESTRMTGASRLFRPVALPPGIAPSPINPLGAVTGGEGARPKDNVKQVRLTSQTEVKRIEPPPPYGEHENHERRETGVGRSEAEPAPREGAEGEPRDSPSTDSQAELQELLHVQERENYMTLDEREDYARKIHKLYSRVINILKNYTQLKKTRSDQENREHFVEVKNTTKKNHQKLTRIDALISRDDEIRRELGMPMLPAPLRIPPLAEILEADHDALLRVSAGYYTEVRKLVRLMLTGQEVDTVQLTPAEDTTPAEPRRIPNRPAPSPPQEIVERVTTPVSVTLGERDGTERDESAGLREQEEENGREQREATVREEVSMDLTGEPARPTESDPGQGTAGRPRVEETSIDREEQTRSTPTPITHYQCTNCWEGHPIAESCPLLQQEQERAGRTIRQPTNEASGREQNNNTPRVCTVCGQEGHISRDCLEAIHEGYAHPQPYDSTSRGNGRGRRRGRGPGMNGRGGVRANITTRSTGNGRTAGGSGEPPPNAVYCIWCGRRDHLFTNCPYCCVLCGSDYHTANECTSVSLCRSCDTRHPPQACPGRTNQLADWTTQSRPTQPARIYISRGVLNRRGSRTNLDVRASGPRRPPPSQDPIAPYQYSVYPPPGHGRNPPGPEGTLTHAPATATHGGVVRRGDHAYPLPGATGARELPSGDPRQYETMRPPSGPPPSYHSADGHRARGTGGQRTPGDEVGGLGGHTVMAAGGAPPPPPREVRDYPRSQGTYQEHETKR